VDSGLKVLNQNSGTFLFNPPRKNGVYYFATQAIDWAGNSEDAPIGDGDTWCEYREEHYTYLPLVLKNEE
jgi:hypothetical protein